MAVQTAALTITQFQALASAPHENNPGPTSRFRGRLEREVVHAGCRSPEHVTTLCHNGHKANGGNTGAEAVRPLNQGSGADQDKRGVPSAVLDPHAIQAISAVDVIADTI